MDPMEQGASVLEAAFELAASRGMNPSFTEFSVSVDPETFATKVKGTSVDGASWSADLTGDEMAAAMGLEPEPAEGDPAAPEDEGAPAAPAPKAEG